jgi:hypothetical protein
MTLPSTYWPILKPPKIVQLVRAFLLGPLGPTPIATRLPSPDNTADTVNGFLRLEYGGGSKPTPFQYDLQCIMHAYSPDENQGAEIADQAVALTSAAQGQTVNGVYVVGVTGVIAAHRLTDPNVILPRFRAAVTWRVPGLPFNQSD